MNIKRTCPICGEDYWEHNSKEYDRLGTLGSIFIAGVSYIVPMSVVSAYDHYKAVADKKTRAIEAIQEEMKDKTFTKDVANERLFKLTDAISNFLNDTREKESIEELEQAMKDYGLQSYLFDE
jgi:hypothetical protein